MKLALPWLKLEGGLILVMTILAYAQLGYNKFWYLGLLLAPDISLAGYLINPQIGRRLYNTGHSYILPGGLLLLGINQDLAWAQMSALIWIGHIGFDRLLGYGLKSGLDFKDTHLGRIGRKK